MKGFKKDLVIWIKWQTWKVGKKGINEHSGEEIRTYRVTDTKTKKIK